MSKVAYVREVSCLIGSAMEDQVKGKEMVILVSKRFYEAAIERAMKMNAILDVDVRGGDRGSYWYLRSVLIHPAPWLDDYEFSIRPLPEGEV